MMLKVKGELEHTHAILSQQIRNDFLIMDGVLCKEANNNNLFYMTFRHTH